MSDYASATWATILLHDKELNVLSIDFLRCNNILNFIGNNVILNLHLERYISEKTSYFSSKLLIQYIVDTTANLALLVALVVAC